MKKFVSILTVVIFSLAFLTMIAPSEAAIMDLYVLGGYGGDGGGTTPFDDAVGGGGGFVGSKDNRISPWVGLGPLTSDSGTSTDVTSGFIMAGIGNSEMVSSGDKAAATGAGGPGGFANVSIASRDVDNLEVIGGDSGNATTQPGGAGGFARLRVSEDLRVSGDVRVYAGASLDARPGSADLNVGGKLIVGNKDGSEVRIEKNQATSGDVSFRVGELVVSPDAEVWLLVDGLASRDVRIPTVTLGRRSTFTLYPQTSLDMGAYGTTTLNVDDKDAKLDDIYIELRSGDILSFNITNAGSGDVMLSTAGEYTGFVIDIKSADNAAGTHRGGIQLNGASGLQVGSYITLIKADRLVSKDYGTTTLVSRVPGSNTGYAFSISYVGNEMRATYKGTTHIGGGGSSGCSAIGFAPFAILLILGAATFGKRK